MHFRKDINGLRAIAVIAVVLFHFNPLLMPGGFAGVDVFFVISGYLMTGIIFRGVEKDSFSILKFYMARARRILPALTVVCAAVMIYGWFNLYDAEYIHLTHQVLTSLSFVSNIFFWKSSGYFAPGADSNILLHTWSLSAEWQFYMAYPILLVICSKIMPLKFLKYVIIASCILSLMISIYASPRWVNSSYYMLPTRAWEMLLGGIACFSIISLSSKNKILLSSLGLITIFLSYVLISKNSVWPGWLAFFPTVGVLLIMLANRDEGFIAENRFLQLIGISSYSIYLWHWPILVISKVHTNNFYIISLVGIPVSLLAGYLSYQYVEKHGFNFKTTALLAITVLASSILLLNNDTFFDKRDISQKEENGVITYYKNYQSHQKSGLPWIENLCNSDSDCIKGGVFLWGDSHGHSVAYGLKPMLEQENIHYATLTTRSCAPSIEYPNYALKERRDCNKANIKALKHIALKKPHTVILARRFRHEQSDWQGMSDKIKSYGVQNVVVLGPVPQYKGELPNIVANKYMDSDSISIHDMDESIFYSNSHMSNIKNSSYQFVDLLGALCTHDQCQVKVEFGDNYSLISFDNGHLTREGSALISTIIKEKIELPD